MNYSAQLQLLHDPIAFAQFVWPQGFYRYKGAPGWFYPKQREIIYSVENNVETVVVAGNKLGKDFVAGFICLRYFLVHREVRVVTTSVKDDHLRVLWGEIGRFIQTARIPLTKEKGGPLVINHRDIRKLVNGEECKISYLRGMVSKEPEGLAGHHAERTLYVIDEASGVSNEVYEQGQGWADRFLIFGNPNPCAPTHFFRKAVKLGNILEGSPLDLGDDEDD